MKIIVADDDAIARRIITKILEKRGHDVIGAEDGDEAWEKLVETNARILVTDWNMPKMSGINLCQKIRDERLPNYVYIIIVTANDQKADAIRGLKAGADDFISKPVDPQELFASIRSGQRVIKLEDDMKNANAHLLQSEKMASIGQLAAGVAHEINNPTGFVSSNIMTLSDYYNDLKELFEKYHRLLESLEKQEEPIPEILSGMLKDIRDFEEEIDIDFIMTDMKDLVSDCIEGMDRIKKIVMDLKDFAHPGEDKIQSADINSGIESTLNVIRNEIKYKAKVIKNFEELPLVECFPHQINQVFMNIIVNAAQAIEEEGIIEISTRVSGDMVEVAIKDNGSGIDKGSINKIFDPFFTTKEAGKGTGLGMNVAYNIIKKHRGSIEVKSEKGKGTLFLVRLPIDNEASGDTR